MIECPWATHSFYLACLDALQQLETALGDLLTRPLDEITADDLDEMLKRYSSIIDDATRQALQQAMLARMSVSQAETNAFLNGQNKVTGYLQPFMNESGWFHDALNRARGIARRDWS